MSGKLYIVATPIGNLGDMSARAIETMRDADLIAAEDTRNTVKLLNHFDIHTPMSANHKFNETAALSKFTAELLAGKNIALVSDAGTPCVNDPGYILVKECARLGVEVIGIPGPCAAATVVSVSGLPSDTFSFMGFFPREKKERESLFEYIKGNRSELYIFYESPNRIEDTLDKLSKEFGDAPVTLCNDLTKLHERIYRGTVTEVLAEIKANPDAGKGEYAFAVYIKRDEESTEDKAEELSTEARLTDVMVKRGCTLKDAVNIVATEAKIPKKEVYKVSLSLKEMME
ncbi:MAG: 16S rRNA (cytidine(1402)-2'-O)-methyltransferase [Lachnospiraceae bacterium]|nr:16S rRNA (cytidine(1402)-2'-O)-methyltransferase [Lachnospiraceae bacterium]